MTPALKTNRLLLVPRTLEDSEQLEQEFAVWEVVRFLTAQVQWRYQAGTARKNFIEKIGPAIARGEEWHWTLRLKDDPEQIIGLISLYRSDDNNRGFWIGRRWQGKGLMSEAVETITDYWFDELGFERLRVPKAVDNIPSRRISERTGMRVISEEERDYVCGRFMSQLWEITADEWHEYRRTTNGRFQDE